MDAKIYTMDGNIVGTLELPKPLFAVAVVPTLVHEVVTMLRGNRRVAIAHTKTRGEVRGGGKKPWKQKGTGRARHGSIRSPIWIGGGVTFGPRSNRAFGRKLNRKVVRKALCMAFSDKAAQEKVVVLDHLTLTAPKTKLMAAIIKKLPATGRTLLVLPKSDATMMRATRNLPQVHAVTANAISLPEVLRYDTVMMPRETLPVLEKLYGNK